MRDLSVRSGAENTCKTMQKQIFTLRLRETENRSCKKKLNKNITQKSTFYKTYSILIKIYTFIGEKSSIKIFITCNIFWNIWPKIANINRDTQYKIFPWVQWSSVRRDVCGGSGSGVREKTFRCSFFLRGVNWVFDVWNWYLNIYFFQIFLITPIKSCFHSVSLKNICYRSSFSTFSQ